MTVDAGTGDGRAVLAAATREPRTLVVGLDADARSMAEMSRRAARSGHRGGAPNALFVVAAVEAVPAALHGLAARVTVRFPWGSLLRGCVGLDPAVTVGLASLVGEGGDLELLLAPAPRDGLAGVPVEPASIVAAASAAFAPHGLCLAEGRMATADEIRGSGSSWARRLLGGGRRRGRPEARGDTAPVRQPVLVRLFRGRVPTAPEGPVEPRTSGRPADDPGPPGGG